MIRESMHYDVLIVGAGPAGLSAAIRLKQLAPEVSVCLLEKGAHVGAHLLSGAVFEPRALEELFPNWKDLGAPLQTPVTKEEFLYLTKRKTFSLPKISAIQNHGNYIISLGKLAKWLAAQAESLGVEIYAGFAASEILYGENGNVTGVATGDMGLNKDGTPGPNHAVGVEIYAKQTLFAEGCRGHLSQKIIEKFKLAEKSQPQTYGLGIKEIWEVPQEQHQNGRVIHTLGWPLDTKTYGGGWVYHYEGNKISIGFVVGLDYENPTLSPYEEMQRFKTHPAIRARLEGGKRISYGARALVEGGFQALPTLSFPGGLLIGDAAGFLNVAKIKGNHTAMKSGMVAAQAVVEHLKAAPSTQTPCTAYKEALQKSWVWAELKAVRNIRPGFKFGRFLGILNAGIEGFLNGKTPWTLSHHADHTRLKSLKSTTFISYPKPDGTLTFDKLTSVQFTNVHHREDQPCHLTLKNPQTAIETNFKTYGSPEQFYCPAGVYEIVEEDAKGPRLQINAQNCIHCKTCDIKDPTQNIKWEAPEGGGGPNYGEM